MKNFEGRPPDATHETLPASLSSKVADFVLSDNGSKTDRFLNKKGDEGMVKLPC
ncbi:MAG: hypothetical protein PHD65_11860 [Gallionella sp.]|nr:hypothetical protein [Gallionella sp.]